MYRMTMPDNDLLFFRGRSDRKRCSVCGQLTAKREENLTSVSIARRPRFDVSCSVDGVVVVSRPVRHALEELFPAEVQFDVLQSELFAALPRSVVRFDSDARKTRFEGRCDTCGQYRSIIGAKPIMLQAGSCVSPDGIARTDLEFGSDDEKAPLIVLGDGPVAAIRTCGFSGCELLPS